MRTTLTLDDDLDGLLRRQAKQAGVSFTEIVNRTLRAGLAREAASPESNPPRKVPHAFGFPRGVDLDRLNQLADELEAAALAESLRVRR